MLYLIALVYWLYETAYFGWNALPESDAELICDGIAIMLFALAIMKHYGRHETNQ